MYRASSQHVDSYYASSCVDLVKARPRFEGELDVDVAIVGAGFSGLHTALRLVLAGKRVALLESSRIGWAASGRNGGQAILGWSCDMPPLEAALGQERARRLWELVRWAAGEIQALPQRHGFDIDYRAGHLWTSVLQRRVSHLHEWQEQASQKWGYDGLQFISKQQLPDWVGSQRYQAGLFDPEGGHLNPLKLVCGLADTIERHGGLIFEQSRALRYQATADGYELHCEQGRVRCGALVLAANTYLDELAPAISQRILPVGTYQVATVPLSAEQAQSLLPRNACVTDNQFVLDYFRLTPDHRLLFGGGCTYLGGLPKDIAAATRPYLERVFPQLRGVPIEFAWGGHIDVSLKRTPDVGGRDNLYWLQGFSGHGVLPTLASARAVADAILGDDADLQVFQQIAQYAFPGGRHLAAPLEAVGKAYYRLRDAF
jgi:glycine/D-amino acid oxidase-like deaminating enzyme